MQLCSKFIHPTFHSNFLSQLLSAFSLLKGYLKSFLTCRTIVKLAFRVLGKNSGLFDRFMTLWAEFFSMSFTSTYIIYFLFFFFRTDLRNVTTQKYVICGTNLEYDTCVHANHVLIFIHGLEKLELEVAELITTLKIKL